MHISLVSTTVKLSYSKHAYNEFTLTVKSISFSLSYNCIINLWSYVTNYCYHFDITHPWHFAMTKFYCTQYTCADCCGRDSHHLGGTWWCGGNTATDPSPPWCPASGTSSGSLTASGYWRCPRPNPWCSDWKRFWNLNGKYWVRYWKFDRT